MPDIVTSSPPASADTFTAPAKGNSITKTLVSFVPLSSVKFSGNDAWIAYSRIALYGVVGATLWKKNRTAAYLFLGSAALSAGTSFMAGQ